MASFVEKKHLNGLRALNSQVCSKSIIFMCPYHTKGELLSKSMIFSEISDMATLRISLNRIIECFIVIFLMVASEMQIRKVISKYIVETIDVLHTLIIH